MSGASGEKDGAALLEILRRRMNRRKFLGVSSATAAGAVVGVAVVAGGAGYFLRGGGAAQTITQTATETQTVTQTQAITSTATSVATSTATTTATSTATTTATTTAGVYQWNIPPSAITGSLTFDNWSYRPELVQSNVSKFNAAYGEQAVTNAVTGDYQVTEVGKMSTGQPLDMLYAQPDQMGKWYANGWLQTINDLPTLQDYINDIGPGYRSLFKHPVTGDQIGLCYYVGYENYLTNQALLEKAGLQDTYPKNLSELHQFATQIKKAGITDTPLVLWWGTAWYELPWQFALDHISEGVQLFDKNLDPVFDTNTPTATILQLWKDAYANGLVPADNLTTSYTDWIGKFSSGTVAYMPEQDYQLATYNDPKQSKFPGKCSFVQNQPGGNSWGWLFPAAYATTKRDRSPEQKMRVYRLLSFFGYKDDKGDYNISKSLSSAPSYILSPFPTVQNDPAVINDYVQNATTYRGAKDFQTLINQKNSAQWPTWWVSPWASDFNVKLVQRIPDAITGKTSVSDTITALRNDAVTLKKQSGG